MKLKSKKQKRQPLIATIGENRILQLSNDMSEGIKSGTVEEWRAVALYFRNLFDAESKAMVAVMGPLMVFDASSKLFESSARDLRRFLEDRKNSIRNQKTSA